MEEGNIVSSQNAPLPVRLIEDWCKWTNLSIHYSPVNLETKEVMEKLQHSCGSADITLIPHFNETTLRNELHDSDEIGIVFPDGLAPLTGSLRGNVTNAVFSYKLLMHASKLPSTKAVLPTQKLGDKDFTAIGTIKKSLVSLSVKI